MADEREKKMDAEEIAEMDEASMPEVRRETLRSPTPGGNPEHRERLQGDSNDLTT